MICHEHSKNKTTGSTPCAPPCPRMPWFLRSPKKTRGIHRDCIHTAYGFLACKTLGSNCRVVTPSITKDGSTSYLVLCTYLCQQLNFCRRDDLSCSRMPQNGFTQNDVQIPPSGSVSIQHKTDLPAFLSAGLDSDSLENLAAQIGHGP